MSTYRLFRLAMSFILTRPNVKIWLKNSYNMLESSEELIKFHQSKDDSGYILIKW